MKGKLAAIVFGILTVITVAQMFHFYHHVNYQADIARGYVEGVLSTNNIDDMKAYFQQGLNHLNEHNYEGAPIPWPTPYQNFDLIKADLQNSINSLAEYQATYTTTSDKSYAYQQTINNAKDNAQTVSDRIAEINGWRGWLPSENPAGYALIFVWGIAILPIIVVSNWWEARPYKREEGYLSHRSPWRF